MKWDKKTKGWCLHIWEISNCDLKFWEKMQLNLNCILQKLEISNLFRIGFQKNIYIRGLLKSGRLFSLCTKASKKFWYTLMHIFLNHKKNLNKMKPIQMMQMKLRDVGRDTRWSQSKWRRWNSCKWVKQTEIQVLSANVTMLVLLPLLKFSSSLGSFCTYSWLPSWFFNRRMYKLWMTQIPLQCLHQMVMKIRKLKWESSILR